MRLWVDAQVRGARFEYRGDEPLGSVSWTFFNPKAGVRFDPSPTLGLYASVGRMGREPARSDMLNGEDNASLALRPLGRASPSGWWTSRRESSCAAAALTARADVYAMEFENEIALTGELSEIGLPVRRNAGRSHRRGVELDLVYTPSAALAPRGDGRAEPQPHRLLDAVLRRVRRRRRLARGDERRLPGRRAAAHAARARERHGRVEADARGRPARGRPLRRQGAARQHRQPGLPHALLLHPRPAGEPVARALGEARSAADPGAGHQPARRPPQLAVRLQLPLLRARRRERDARRARPTTTRSPPAACTSRSTCGSRRRLDAHSAAEIAGVVFGVLYVWLAIRESPWCWPFGIANAALFLVVFAHARLYGAAALQVVYVVRLGLRLVRVAARRESATADWPSRRTPRRWLAGLGARRRSSRSRSDCS